MSNTNRIIREHGLNAYGKTFYRDVKATRVHVNQVTDVYTWLGENGEYYTDHPAFGLYRNNGVIVCSFKRDEEAR